MNKLYRKKTLEKLFYAIIMFVITIQFLNTSKIVKLSEYNLKVISAVGMVAVVMLFKRDYFLPFLGDTVFPNGLLKETAPINADKTVIVKVPNERKVVYWASEPNTNTDIMPWTAYKKYDNAGVTMSDSDGNAKLSVRTPTSYKVPWGKKLKAHIHYRYTLTNGMFSSIKTVYL
jgi:hypothetical protein